jgi:hypothetical protein
MRCFGPGLLVIALALSTLSSSACAQSPEPTTTRPISQSAYPWLAEWRGSLPPLARLEDRFPTPHNLRRVKAEAGSFAEWLRGLPVRLDRSRVLSYRSRPIAAPAAAVIALDLEEGDLQQCADTLVRLHAEYLWSCGLSADAGYHFTSGDLSTWQGWQEGERFAVKGRNVRRVQGPKRPADHGSYRSWLQHLFIYAGTLSLALDSRPVPAGNDLMPGDLFVDPGSPGHAVMVFDVAVDDQGRRWGLIGQGYTPAQDLHVLLEDGRTAIDGVWFRLPEGDSDRLDTPSWSSFPRTSARRFGVVHVSSGD